MSCLRKNYFSLKTSICRKNSNIVRTRQRQKIRKEIMRNYMKLAQLKMFEQNKKSVDVPKKKRTF